MDTQPGQLNIPHGDDSDANRPQPATQGTYAQPAPAAPAVPQQPQVAAAPLPDASVLPPPTLYNPNGGATLNTADPASAAPQYYEEDEAVEPAASESLPPEVAWTASEFIEHPKGAGWYGLLALAAVVLAAVDYLVTRDIVSTSVIIIAAVLFGVYAGHKPRTQQYYLSPKGLRIGAKLYGFQSFKAFSVASEGAIASIVFTPLGRFAPSLTVYVASDLEDSVLDYLSNFLPFEQRRADAVDGLLRRIKF